MFFEIVFKKYAFRTNLRIHWIMNVVVLGLFLCGIAAALLSGQGDLVLQALTEGAETAIETCIKLLAAYLVWMGLLNVAKEAGWIRALSRLLRPVLRLLFPNAGDAKEAISMNLAANMLGMQIP